MSGEGFGGTSGTMLSKGDGGRRDHVLDLLDAIGTVFVGDPDAVRVAVSAFLAGGHILLEDVPGVGKTLL
ncbi:MAG TPA: hypothetical protein VK507_11470, partial [Iamia sp.]|nr:hypothetical protein [Iamia sp.]